MDMRLVTHTKLQENGCLEWQRRRNACGYGTIQVEGRQRLAHRYAWQQMKGDIPEGMCVLHTCDNPSCINMDHLFLGTPKTNAVDRMLKGRGVYRYGDQHASTKIPSTVVEAIRKESGLLLRELSSKYRVSISQVSKIIKGQVRRHG